MKDKNNEWFKLENIELETEKFNNFNELERELKHAEKISTNSWNLSYIKINAILTFMGKLNTPNGEVNTEFTYYIKSDFSNFTKNAEIEIYEQTFTGLDKAVTIRFSSGSIISKIVFGDIEKCYLLLKEQVKKLVEEYNQRVEKFNKKIDEAKEKTKAEGENE